jgi:hypothetical protein
MKQPTVLLATLATGLILVLLVINLAVCSQERDLCRISVLESQPCKAGACIMASLPTIAPTHEPSPTLAPPRSEAKQVAPSSQDLAKRQPVFLRVETDQNEIEVGWASP